LWLKTTCYNEPIRIKIDLSEKDFKKIIKTNGKILAQVLECDSKDCSNALSDDCLYEKYLIGFKIIEY